MEAILEYEDILSVLTGKIIDKLRSPFYKAFARERIVISSEQYTILACLVRKNMVTQQTLCVTIKKDKPNVTRLLDRLENKRLVQRLPDAEDKRKKRICITELGKHVYDRVNCIVGDTMSHATKNIDKQQMVVFQNVLRHMITNLSTER